MMKLVPIVILAILLCSVLGSAEEPLMFDPDKPENFDSCMKSSSCREGMRNWYSTGKQAVGLKPEIDDKYFGKTANVKASPEAARAYFGKKENVEKMLTTNAAVADMFFSDPTNIRNSEDLSGARKYFSTPGSLGKNPESAHEFFQKEYNTDITIAKGSDATYNPRTNELLNKGAVDLISMNGEDIRTLGEGGFEISGNKYTDFAKISKENGMMRMDDMVAKPVGKGNEFSFGKSHLHEGTYLASAEKKGDLPTWSVKANAPLDIYTDENAKVEKLSTAAVSATKGGVLANKFAQADITNGPMSGKALGGTLGYNPLDDATIKKYALDPDFQKSEGYHIGVDTGIKNTDGKPMIDRADLNTFGERALTEGLQKGTKSPVIDRLNRMLNDIGYNDIKGNPLPIGKGVFGSETEFALKDFQESNGLEPTGVLDKKTLENLYEESNPQQHSSIDGFQKGSMYEKKPKSIYEGKEEIGQAIGKEWPAEGTFTSTYSEKTALRGYRMHGGIDIAGESGSPVRTPVNGIVIYAKEDNKGSGLGGTVQVYDPTTGELHGFHHLSKVEVKAGDMVKSSTEVGKMGSTGSSTAPHLDWKILNVQSQPKMGVKQAYNLGNSKDPRLWMIKRM